MMQDYYVTTLSSLQQTTCTSPCPSALQHHSHWLFYILCSPCERCASPSRKDGSVYQSTDKRAQQEPAKEIQAQVSNGCDPDRMNCRSAANSNTVFARASFQPSRQVRTPATATSTGRPAEARRHHPNSFATARSSRGACSQRQVRALAFVNLPRKRSYSCRLPQGLII